MNILNPTYSFVQFSDGSTPPECDYSLPIALDTDLKFQVIIETDGVAQSENMLGADQKLYVVDPGAVITDESSLAANILLELSGVFFFTNMTADDEVLMCWTAGLANIESFAEKTCFRLCARIDDGTDQFYFISNCFIKINDFKYTSTLEYYSEINNYGFNYCDGCVNKIRIALYIGKPQSKETQTVYEKSDGDRKILSYSASKLYEMDTDVLHEELHDKIKIALAHDVVNIESSRYTGGIRKDGDYVIDWDRMIDMEATATTSVYAVPYLAASNNCAECSDYIEPTLCAKISSINGAAEKTAVECAPISSINGFAQTESSGFSVVLGRSGSNLTAIVSGGVGPYNYHFYCIPDGEGCESYTIDAPDQTTSLDSALTHYSYLNYAGITYNFYVQVTDATSATATDGPNAPTMCLVPETIITMADGSKRQLRNIKAGDEVADIDVITGERKTTIVKAKNNFVVDKIFRINDTLLKTSEGHINVVKDGDAVELLASADLNIDDILFSDDLTEIRIDTIETEEGKFDVINIATESGTYIANGILTHNKLACP